MADPLRLPRLLTERAAADALAVSVDTLRRARKAGKVRHTMIGGRVRYTEAHLVDYIAAGERFECPKGSEKSAAIGYPSAPTVPLGAEHGSTPPLDRHVVHRSAQAILSKRS